MGEVRYSLLDPRDVVLLVLIAELCDIQPPEGEHYIVNATFLVRNIRTAGRTFVERYAGSIEELIEAARSYRDLLSYRQGECLAHLFPRMIPKPFIDATESLIRKCAQEVAQAPYDG